MTEEAKEHSAFKVAQLRHRRQGAAPHRTDDFAELVDFSNANNNNTDDHQVVALHFPASVETGNPRSSSSLLDYYRGPLYCVASHPGFVCAPHALSSTLQRKLAYLAVSHYCEQPNASNIDLVPCKAGIEEDNTAEESMWALWKQDHGFVDFVPATSTDGNVKAATTSRKRTRDNKTSKRAKKKYRSFDKLSWATMGYHYDWTARSYREESKSRMPHELQSLCELFARTCLALEKEDATAFTASACIVNYYDAKSTMGGHRDDLELTFDKPVVSFSLGLPAIFLLGGKTKEECPVTPILARPGDVMMLGGDSRLNFHGVARIIPADVPLPAISESFSNECAHHQVTDLNNRRSQDPQLSDDNQQRLISRTDNDALDEFLSRYRININVRQVLPDGQDEIPADARLPQSCSRRLET